jgi:glycosyltransferase involved in cell wall biosynthesis
MSIDSDVRRANPLVIKLFWKMVLRSAQTIIVKERESANRVASYVVDRNKVVILPNGVDKSRFRLNRLKCREQIGLKDNEKAILYVGRLEPVKNVESLLIAFAKIREQFQDVRLLLVGTGTEMSRLVRIAAQTQIDRFTSFVGRVSLRDVPRYMVAADILVLPSISEGSPNVVLEALAAGVPVLASNVGGVPDLVRHRREGLLFEPGDVSQMVDSLTIMLQDSQLMRKMSKEGKKRADRFPLDGVNDKIFQMSMDAVREYSTRELRDQGGIPRAE